MGHKENRWMAGATAPGAPGGIDHAGDPEEQAIAQAIERR